MIIAFPSRQVRALRKLFRMAINGKPTQLINPNCPCPGCRAAFGGARPTSDILADLLPGLSSEARQRLAAIPNLFIMVE